jgi:proline dehydrogenase
MLRALLLYLSSAGWAKTLITHFFVARRVARRFVAGETLEDALRTVKRLKGEGLDVTLDYLGESVHSEADAARAVDEYLEILEAIQREGLAATVSLKLTQLGLDVSPDICLANMRRILKKAQATNNHVTIDMESTAYTDRTLQVFRTLHHENGFANVGTVIQAYLYRSAEDMAALHTEDAFIRLCKGAYKEPPTLAYPEKRDVDANYVKLMQDYLSGNETGAYLGIATHDAQIIETARAYIQAEAIPHNRFEFQMLYGIRADLQRELVRAGYKMRVYVPFGTQWYPYFMRRLAERPANLWFFVSNLFRG